MVENDLEHAKWLKHDLNLDEDAGCASAGWGGQGGEDGTDPVWEVEQGAGVWAGGDRDPSLSLQQHAGTVRPTQQQKQQQQEEFSQQDKEYVLVINFRYSLIDNAKKDYSVNVLLLFFYF